MSTDMIDTAYGHACCVAVHHNPSRLGAYHAHLVGQVGAAAPTQDEIKALGAEVSSAWGMGVNPRCFACGATVAKGGCCSCLVERLPFRASSTRAKEMAARGDKSPAAKFACGDCGSGDTMTAEQLLRQNGVPYKLCTRCVRSVAMAAKAAKAHVDAQHAAQAAHNAVSQQLLAAAKAEAAGRIVMASTAYEGACKALEQAKSALSGAARALELESDALKGVELALAPLGLRPEQVEVYTMPVRGRITKARENLAKAQARFDSASTRVDVTKLHLSQAQAAAGVS